MSKGARWIMALMLVLTGLAAVPGQAMAQECVKEFEKCLNDTWDTSGFTRLLANLECATEYAACLVNKF